jgi:hypothetical protein
MTEQNMQAILVGVDRLGNIPQLLSDYGVNILHHLSGRDTAHQRRANLPKEAELVIIFTDFMNHNTMRHYRDAAKDRGIPFLACPRSTVCLKECMDRCLGGSRACAASCPRKQNRH